MMKEDIWFALYTKPRAEKRALTALKKQNVECYLPLHRTPRVWSDRIKMVDMPLFNSYIFVKCDEMELYKLVYVDNIVRVVFFNGRPAVIRQDEIDAIQVFLKEAEGKTLCTGDEVEILIGPMKHIFGKVTRIEKKYLILQIKELAVTVCVNTESVAHKDRL
ncbi:MAG: UpxY family transcription antiterminator [Tannerella sp.]|jgi:transcription antitermination factor NusG|nr:UpxY family transcription antiterminator [Tannerella sp.]